MSRTDETGQHLIDYMLHRNYYQPAPKPAQDPQTSSLTEDWYTHPSITELVRELYDGVIDLDPMSCLEANTKYVKAQRIYTAEQDGLTYEWIGRVLLNPPWGGSAATSTKMRAIKKALYEYQSGRMTECVLILNSNATTTAWFEPLFAFPICFPPRRIPHMGPDGKGGAPNTGTVIIYMGSQRNRFANLFSRVGNVVWPLRRAATAAVGEAENYEDE